MEYRILRAEDIINNKKELIELMRIVLSDNITQQFPDSLPEQYVSKIPGYIDDGSAIVSGAFDKDCLVGFSWAYELRIFEERRAHIDMIGVNPDYRKRGIAKRLIEIQIEEIKTRGITIIEAMTTKSNQNSYNWFHSLGFKDERVKVRMDLE